jgi:hypothetical protein
MACAALSLIPVRGEWWPPRGNIPPALSPLVDNLVAIPDNIRVNTQYRVHTQDSLGNNQDNLDSLAVDGDSLAAANLDSLAAVNLDSLAAANLDSLVHSQLNRLRPFSNPHLQPVVVQPLMLVVMTTMKSLPAAAMTMAITAGVVLVAMPSSMTRMERKSSKSSVSLERIPFVWLVVGRLTVMSGLG